jgi:hypothetical protein
MVEVITYSLRDGQKRSDQYYKDVAVFTDEVLAEGEDCLQALLDAYQQHLHQTGRETPRTRAEYTFELLTLGVIWSVYTSNALRLIGAPRRLSAGLVSLRQRSKLLKPGIDFLRGVLTTLFLFPSNHHTGSIPVPTLDNLENLLHWLEAAGDFKEEVKRLHAWRDYLAGETLEDVVSDLGAAISFASWFEARSKETLGRYTPNVERFLVDTHPDYRWREDAIFCGRRRVEYHLNMVGTEILNRAFRDAFLEMERRVVLLPPCMRAKPESECEARQTPFGQRCAGCTPGCRVHQVANLGEKHGFDVLIMPHELSVFSNGGVKPAQDSALGIVGVSCPLTNVTGGWETRDLGIPAQGVLLDYCGCPWHWHREGIPTDINLYQLLQVLGLGGRNSPRKSSENLE